MSAFFGGAGTDSQNSGAQAPVVAGTTSREQFAPQTGATTPQQTGGGSAGGGTGSGAAPTAAAPTASSAAAPPQQAASAPAFNSFSTWLGANQASGQQETQSATAGATSAASAANQATQGFTNYANSSASQGTDTGYVGSAPSASSAASRPTQAQADAGLQNAASNPSATNSAAYGVGFSQSQETQQSQNAVPLALLASGANTSSLASGPAPFTGNQATGSTYDLSNVNLAGYGGPSTDQQQASQQGQALAAQQAAATQQATALQAAQSGAGAQNSWDAALMQQGPERNAVLQALQSVNMAGSNAGAAQQGAVTGVGNATAASNVDVNAQKAALTTAASTEAATASTNAANEAATTGSLSSAIASASTPAQMTQDLQQYAPYLQSLGISGADLGQLQSLAQSGGLTPAALQGVIAQATANSGYSGYNAAAAANTNSINSLLGSGAATVSGNSLGAVNDSSTIQQAQQNQAAINYLKQQDAGTNQSGAGGIKVVNNIGTDIASDNYSSLDNTVGYLSQNGMSPQQIASALGLSGDEATQFVNHYAGHANDLQAAYGTDSGASFNQNQATQSTQLHW